MSIKGKMQTKIPLTRKLPTMMRNKPHKHEESGLAHIAFLPVVCYNKCKYKDFHKPIEYKSYLMRCFYGG